MHEVPSAVEPPSLSGDDVGRVFREPWEAQAFALVVKLYEADYFTWPEWVEALAAEIETARAQGDADRGDADRGDTYYRHWLAAAETLVQAKGLVSSSELRLRRLEVAANIDRHVHQARREPVKIG